MIEHYSTRQVEPARKLDFWNELVGQTYDGLVVDPLQPQFHAHMMRWKLQDLTLVRPRSAGAVVARRRESGVHSIRQNLVLHIVQSGTIMLSHRGREVQLGAGDMAVCASEEYYRFDVKGAHELLVVELDRHLVESRVSGLDDIVGERVSGALASTRILRDFMLSLWRVGEGECAEDNSADYASILTNLFVSSLRPRQDGPADKANPLIARMKALVNARYSDPYLSSASIAEELGVGLRTLQMAMATASITPMEYLSRVRLEAAQALLCDRNMSIAAIGYACGFGDQAYFSRRFSQHFGLCPSEYRKRH